jgi:hypothetical protein
MIGDLHTLLSTLPYRQFPINRRHQRLATVQEREVPGIPPLPRFQSIGVTKDWQLLQRSWLYHGSGAGVSNQYASPKIGDYSYEGRWSEIKFTLFPINMRRQ